MQAQLASNITLQGARGKKLKGRISHHHHHHISVHHQLSNDNDIHLAESNFKEYRTKSEESAKGRTKATKVHKLGFSYFPLSFRNILRKVKAFYG